MFNSATGAYCSRYHAESSIPRSRVSPSGHASEQKRKYRFRPNSQILSSVMSCHAPIGMVILMGMRTSRLGLRRAGCQNRIEPRHLVLEMHLQLCLQARCTPQHLHGRMGRGRRTGRPGLLGWSPIVGLQLQAAQW